MIMMTLEQKRKKYLEMAKSENLDKAVTALHNEIGKLEPRTYDGGFNQQRFEELQALRELARELWTMRLDPNVKKTKV